MNPGIKRDIAEIDHPCVRRDSDRSGSSHSRDHVVSDDYNGVVYRSSAGAINQPGCF